MGSLRRKAPERLAAPGPFWQDDRMLAADNPDHCLVTTADGSHTIHLQSLDEHYHSRHGAAQEARHIFIRHGYEAAQPIVPRRLRLLEMGFGTGLNALLTWESATRDALPVSYTTIEAHPLAATLVGRLNHAAQTPAHDAAAVFAALHDCAWGVPHAFGRNFSFRKWQLRLQDFQPQESFDLLYYDAFSPKAQPELWTRAIFDKLYSLLADGGMLLTYCAKGEVKRNLKAASFSVENLPGPPGKREITRARKSCAYGSQWHERIDEHFPSD